jgi:hypothetical protein
MRTMGVKHSKMSTLHRVYVISMLARRDASGGVRRLARYQAQHSTRGQGGSG